MPGIDLWHMRDGFGYGLSRALCAVGFGFVPSLSARLGDSALAIVSAVLAMLLLGVVFLLLRMNRPVEWRLVADSATLLVLVPVLVTSSGLAVADARFGGRGINFLAASAAVACLFVVIVVIATRGGADRNAAGQIGGLPAAFSIVIIIMGTSYFSAGAISRGLSIAWMAAAVVTVVVMLVPVGRRSIFAPAAFALFTAALVISDILGDGGSALNAETSAIAVMTTLFVAAVLIIIPIPPRRVRSAEPPPE
jgi:hypothetical protein